MANQIYRAPAYSHNTWRKAQIFTDPNTAEGLVSGGVVPNVNDIVITWNGSIKFEERVVSVDELTDLSTLEPVELPNNGNPAMVGIPIGVANLSNVANLLVNPEDPMFSSAIDGRLPIYGVNVAYVKIFLGSDITASGQVIAVRKDTNGDLIDDKVALVRENSTDVSMIRYAVDTFYATYALPEDTLVTAVFYSDNDGPLMYQSLVVKHSHLISNVMHQSQFITSVTIDSPYQNPLDPMELLVPLNHLQGSFNPAVYKNYQNGTRQLVDSGSGRLTMSGWGKYIHTGVGRSHPLVLTYTLATGELSQNVDKHSGYHIVSHYTIKVVANDQPTLAKIFVIANWDNVAEEYVLSYHLYTGGRAAAVDVTDLVTTTPFDGTRFGLRQTVNIALDLTAYVGLPDDVHTCSVEIQLIGAPRLDTTMYRIWYSGDSERWHGEGLYGELRTNYGINTISISNYIPTFDAWLDTMFHTLQPIYDDTILAVAPTPEYVDIYIGDNMVTMNVMDRWDGEVVWPHDTPVAGDVLTMHWYSYSTGGQRLDLAISNMQMIVQ